MKLNKILSLSAVFASFALVGCGDSLLDDLSENTTVSEGDGGLVVAADYKEAAGMFLTAQRKLQAIDDSTLEPHEYQAKNNLYIDNFAGYTAGTNRFFGNLPSTYRYYKDYAEGPKYAFFKVAQSALPVVRSAEKLGLKELGAMCSILYSYAALELADTYGPFPWSDYKNDKQESPLTYVPVKDIYDSLFVDLKKAEAVLADFSNTSDEHKDSINGLLLKYDRLFVKNNFPIPVTAHSDLKTSKFDDPTGKLTNVENWRRFANTIRLRMAMRMTNVNPDRAKEEAKAAYDSGLITSTVAFNDPSVTMHPLFAIAERWDDTRINASFQNILERLDCPLLGLLFDKNEQDIKNPEGKVVIKADSMVVGVKTGISLKDKDDSNPYIRFSKVSQAFNSLPVSIFRVSEMWFLLAEANLRWDNQIVPENSAKHRRLYMNGVKAMFVDFGLTESDASQYMKLASAKDVDYFDYSLSTNNKFYKTEGLIEIGTQYDEDAEKKQLLEMIITQKWIGNFPYGLEAWNDLRRTGYPRIFVQTTDIGDGTIEPGMIIRRLPWDESETALAGDIISSGLDALTQDNSQYNYGNYMNTRLWWDVKDPSGLGSNDRF